MVIETEFDLGDKVFLLDCGTIREGKVTKILIEFFLAGRRSISYLTDGAKQYGQENMFRTREGAGERLLENNGLQVSIKGIEKGEEWKDH